MRLAEITTLHRQPRVTRNPTATRLAALIKNSKEKSLRGVLSDDELVVWDAYLATHHDMGYGGVRDGDGTYLIEIDEEGVQLHLAYTDPFDRYAWNWDVIGVGERAEEMTDDELVDAICEHYRNVLKSNPHLQRAYGGEPPVIITTI